MSDTQEAEDIVLSPADESEKAEKKTRFVLLWLLVAAGWFVGFMFMRFSDWISVSARNRAGILSAIVLVLLSAPFVTFLSKQWYVRRNEFRNRLSDGALLCYLERYWWRRASPEINFGNVLNKRKIESSQDMQKKADTLFLEIYHEQYGLWAFMTPFVLLAIVTFASAALISSLWGCDLKDMKCQIYGANPNLATAAISGAYMFAVGDAVASVRQNSLNVADVYWYALRLVIAIPLGIAVGNVSSGATTDAHTLAAFGLGALPIDEIQKQLRRFTMVQLQAGDAKQDPDQLLSLEGATARTSTVLTAEGVTSVSQLASRDPVLLAVRTGLDFDFILFLISQAVVRRHLGASSLTLVPLGLVEAQAIRQLVDMLNGDVGEQAKARALKTLEDATQRITAALNTPNSPSNETVRTTFEQIAESPITLFLAHVAPRGFRIRGNKTR